MIRYARWLFIFSLVNRLQAKVLDAFASCVCIY
ncbi:hypothetical protein CbuK_1069 [Coxiella burnetii CbuK_Q154]|nr:hypothetical protein CbuK_1069 [Coxiella burnetii CbuK_Q154]